MDSSVTRLGYFCKVLATHFLSKPQIYWSTFWANFKNINFYGKQFLAYFCATLRIN